MNCSMIMLAISSLAYGVLKFSLLRYPPHGPRTIVVEEGVKWERLRAPPMDTPAHDLHASDCLHDLHPGDHIEVQWRRNKEFPYGELLLQLHSSIKDCEVSLSL